MDYFDLNLGLTKEDMTLKEGARQFAIEVMRPVAKELDLMSPEEAVGKNSPLWMFIRKAYELGYHKILMPEAFGGLGLTPLQIAIVQEELGWGSFGLAAYLATTSVVSFNAWMTGDRDLIQIFGKPFSECTDGSISACLGITEPDIGSDVIGAGETFYDAPRKMQCRARLDGDEWVIHGQKSSWISCGCTASHIILHAQVDASKGLAGQGMFLFPLDLKGISRGKPLHKIGQRELNQTELFFDDVRIPKKWMIVGPEKFGPVWMSHIALLNLMMGVWSAGLARAAFEEAFSYAKERVQGGRPLIEHYTMKQRLFDMFTKVELCRAICRAVANLNLGISPPFTEYSMILKTKCSQMAFENAHEAVQILGGNGLTQEYLTEKLFRDSRTALVMDGNNEILARAGGWLLSEYYPRNREQMRLVQN